jgi:carbohydrate kinase (thermoresistant glucokinase family)
MIIVIIGPMGCGKTTIGKQLAARLGYYFDDADDFHPPENISKMKRCFPLTDSDRWGWLSLLNGRIRDRRDRRQHLVLACSALKQSYRDLLGIDQKTVISVYLKGSFNLLKERISRRAHKYMDKNLLTSQMETLEEPTGGLIVDINRRPEMITDEIIAELHLKEKL